MTPEKLLSDALRHDDPAGWALDEAEEYAAGMLRYQDLRDALTRGLALTEDRHAAGCQHKVGCAVRWNPVNNVVQCHGCGTVYVPRGLALTGQDGMEAFTAGFRARHEWPEPSLTPERLARLLGPWHPVDPDLSDFRVSKAMYDNTTPTNQRAMREHAAAILAALAPEATDAAE